MAAWLSLLLLGAVAATLEESSQTLIAENTRFLSHVEKNAVNPSEAASAAPVEGEKRIKFVYSSTDDPYRPHEYEPPVLGPPIEPPPDLPCPDYPDCAPINYTQHWLGLPCCRSCFTFNLGSQPGNGDFQPIATSFFELQEDVHGLVNPDILTLLQPREGSLLQISEESSRVGTITFHADDNDENSIPCCRICTESWALELGLDAPMGGPANSAMPDYDETAAESDDPFALLSISAELHRTSRARVDPPLVSSGPVAASDVPPEPAPEPPKPKASYREELIREWVEQGKKQGKQRSTDPFSNDKLGQCKIYQVHSYGRSPGCCSACYSPWRSFPAKPPSVPFPA
eukprot:GILJ01003221.1.p1 GENE.GILJ01003221.1~~GILJ01003221.1.p1  ORF type:complete len:344 (-),score=19.08 GILJ01003221.1:172-1203(-)